MRAVGISSDKYLQLERVLQLDRVTKRRLHMNQQAEEVELPAVERVKLSKAAESRGSSYPATGHCNEQLQSLQALISKIPQPRT